MSFTSGGTGEDSLQIGLAVFAIVISLVVTSLVPAIVPEYDADGDALADARQKMENFTGESMISYSPWQLSWVATPYTANSQERVFSEYGWVFGSISNTYSYDGTSYIGEEVVRFDPGQKSDYPLTTNTEIPIHTIEDNSQYSDDWYEFGILGPIISKWWNEDVLGNDPDYVDNGIFDFTGLLYHFDPTYRISTEGSSATKLNSDWASLNVLWYGNTYGSGISGGLILHSNTSNAIIAHYNSSDIIRDAKTDSQFATKYLLNFEGVQVYMYILFDTEVLTAGASLEEAWENGNWRIAFSTPSADGLMDIFNSNDLSSSIGNLIDTYISIFTFDMPNCPTIFNVVFWVVCVLPMTLAMLMFLSRFGIAGMGAGVLGMALSFIGLA